MSEGAYLLEQSMIESAGDDLFYEDVGGGPVTWNRKSSPGYGYECSSKGDSRFSALHAKMPDGRTIEEWYQCDIKGYSIGGRNWRLGKGRPPVFPYPDDHLWQMYLSLWRIWAVHHGDLILELRDLAAKHGELLTDCFASTDINQARALATILNEWVIPQLDEDPNEAPF